ncbi:PIN domain-containing protein, partial [Photobacterium sanguinicancri]|uniref:PIN domain-containing protein n=1 Tax=Photobacterium sanguinicancri TaxID=875932 RepID=UPI001961650B
MLDTNILHQEGLNSGRMQLLKKLIDVEFVRLHIPEIVKNEFITKKAHTASDLMTKSANNLKTVNANFETSECFKEELQKIEDNIR